jgi:ABC-type dipeptide/oligopeptide/nickel transport system ATPase component
MIAPVTSSSSSLLQTSLSVAYRGKPPVLRNIELEIDRREILGLVGQSGSGKSTLALAILGLLDRKKVTVEGRILFQESDRARIAQQGTDLQPNAVRENDLLQMRERELRALRGRSLGLVLQSPLSSLNPALKIRTQLREAWRAHAQGTSADCDAAIRASLSSVSLPADEDFLRRHPAQLSIGQAQRVLIAMTIIHRPALLIADEATSALDVITQAEILALFAQLNRETGMAILYISHDLPSVARICHRIAILHQGEIVETGSSEQIFNSPQHPYTRKLIAALPTPPAPNLQQSNPREASAASGR